MLTSHSRLFDTLVISSRNVVDTECDGEIIVLSIEQGRCYGLNRMGSLLWRQLAEPVRVADLVEDWQHAFGADAAFCSSDILDFLESLMAEKLLETVHRTAESRPSEPVKPAPDLTWERPVLMPFDLADTGNTSRSYFGPDGI